MNGARRRAVLPVAEIQNDLIAGSHPEPRQVIGIRPRKYSTRMDQNLLIRPAHEEYAQRSGEETRPRTWPAAGTRHSAASRARTPASVHCFRVRSSVMQAPVNVATTTCMVDEADR